MKTFWAKFAPCRTVTVLTLLSWISTTQCLRADIVLSDISHHYGFDGTVEDTVGNADGTTIGNSSASTALPLVGSGSLRNDAGTAKDGLLNGTRINGIVSTLNDGDFAIALWYRADPLPNSLNNELRFPRFFSAATIIGPNGAGLAAGTRTIDEWTFASAPGISLSNSGNDSTLLGEWNHTVITRDSNQWQFFVNGTLIDQTATNTPALTFTEATVGALTFGTAGTGEVLQNNRDFTGFIDELTVFNRALSSQEVGELYANPALVANATVPEPSVSLGMLGLAFSACLFRGRKRSSRER